MSTRRKMFRTLVPIFCVIVGVGLPSASTGVLSVPPTPEVSYQLEVGKPGRVCAGSELEVRVALKRRIPQPLPWGGLLSNMDAVPVTAKVVDPHVLEPPESLQVTGWDNSSPPTTWFTFKAKKAGLTTITFTANIAGMADLEGELRWPGVLQVDPVPREVRVVDCRYRVLVVSSWDFPESNLAISAAFEGAELRFEAEGSASATATVNWGSGSIARGGCSFKETIDPSTATLSGEIDEQGVLRIKVTWADANIHNVSSCPVVGGRSATVVATPAPITIEMAQGERFRNSSTAQSLSGAGGSRDGFADFEIVAVVDER